jgi:hypothetical protein
MEVTTELNEQIEQAKEGEVIMLPEGAFYCSEPIIIRGSITLAGAGIGKTYLVNMRQNWTEAALVAEGSIDDTIRITGITFTGHHVEGVKNNSNCINIKGDSRRFRIDNCMFTNAGAHSIAIDGHTYGVIDHCEFVNDSKESITIRDGSGSRAWQEVHHSGGIDAVYIEDCSFIFETKGDHAVTSVNGGRYVFRHNRIESSYEMNATQVDTHGNFFNERGGYCSEIYGNRFISENSYYGIYIRGGTGVIFDNTLEGLYYLPVCFANYRSFKTPPDESPGPCGYSACIYPAPDQIHNFYLWNNTYKGEEISVTVRARGLEQMHIQQDRDFFYREKPGYTPLAYPHPVATTSTP